MLAGMTAKRCAGILLRDHVGRILMQFRDDWATSDPLCFSLFGGAALEGETDLETALREAHEELGVRLRPEDVREAGSISWHNPRNGVTAVVTMFEAVRPITWGEFVINEGEGAAFLSKDQIESLPFVSGVAKAFVKNHA